MGLDRNMVSSMGGSRAPLPAPMRSWLMAGMTFSLSGSVSEAGVPGLDDLRRRIIEGVAVVVVKMRVERLAECPELPTLMQKPAAWTATCEVT